MDGTEIALEAQSICVHGDTPAAVSIARSVREALVQVGVEMKSFTHG